MKTAINTKTQEEYDALMRYYKSIGIDYFFLPEEDYWTHHGEQTCVIISDDDCLEYSPASFYKEQGYEIIPYTEFAKTIKPEIDFKALYLEGRELLSDIVIFSKENGDIINGFKTREAVISAREYLTKHNDLT